jgi:saccharopine dehydrogenase-like NADP-dependent oxidoreductase
LNSRVLVLGGYGVFGARVSAGLVADGWDVIVAGRSLTAAQAHCTAQGGKPMVLNRNAHDFATQVAGVAPFAVVDAAGPFQAYDDAHVVQAAMAAGAHYLDLSDDAGFTAAITAHDGMARDKGLVVLSGASTVPALSSAIAADLVAGLMDVHLIESTILPGNRAPRGLAVIAAILAQVGRPLTVWREGWVTRERWHLPCRGYPCRRARPV